MGSNPLYSTAGSATTHKWGTWTILTVTRINLTMTMTIESLIPGTGPTLTYTYTGPITNVKPLTNWYIWQRDMGTTNASLCWDNVQITQ